MPWSSSVYRQKRMTTEAGRSGRKTRRFRKQQSRGLGGRKHSNKMEQGKQQALVMYGLSFALAFVETDPFVFEILKRPDRKNNAKT